MPRHREEPKRASLPNEEALQQERNPASGLPQGTAADGRPDGRSAEIQRKTSGFPGQKTRHIPAPVIAQHRRDPLLAGLLPTYTGFFPAALGHCMRRPGGLGETIIIYCASGRGWYEALGRRWEVGSGDVLFCWKDTPHAYGAQDDDPWTIHWLHCVGEDLGPFGAQLGVGPEAPVARVGRRFQVIDLFEELLETLYTGYSQPHLLHASCCLRKILSSFILGRMYHNQGQEGALNVEQVIGLMRRSLQGMLTLDEMAELVHLSPSHFSRKFRRQTGYAPIEYFNRLKMQRACELLDSTALPVGRVAQELGYEDPYYFSRVFRKLVGRSPREYRGT